MTTNNFLLKLYRGASDLPAGQFKDWALSESKQLIGFDACYWGTGSWNDGVPTVHSAHLHNLDKGLFHSWSQYSHQDTLAIRMVQNLDRTFNVNVASEYANTEFYKNHCKRYAIEHIVSTMAIDPDTCLLNFIVLYRSDQGSPFTEEERKLKETIFPHLNEAARLNWLANLPHMYSSVQKSSFNSLATCYESGTLQVVMPSFVDAIRKEWPGWKGPNLPPEVIDAITSTAKQYVGKHTVFEFYRLGDLIILRIRSRVLADNLSERELEIAHLFSEGSNYKSIAQELSLSPSTVRNHLSNIYLKLAINNKSLLVLEIAKLAY